jgi:phospholipid/cholesterol/gamma-HCH transport system substrate-binding protein
MAQSDIRKQITVGIFIFLGLLIFVVGIFTLGGQRKSFVKSFTVNVIFDDIQGLKTGNNVWYSGVKIGTIKKIQFYGKAQVQVTVNIDEEAHRYIHKDAKASIGSDGLIGNKIIVITGGNPKYPFVEDGDRLLVQETLSTDDIMKTFQVNNKNLVDITGDFRTLARNLVDGKGTAGALLTDEKIATNFKTIVANLQRTTASTDRMARDLDQFSKKLNTKGGLADKMLTDTAVFARLKASVNELQKTARSASALTQNLNNASSKLTQTDNAAGLLLNDPKTADQVRAIMGNLKTSSENLNQDLEALQSNWLLKGFFKKKVKDTDTAVK